MYILMVYGFLLIGIILVFICAAFFKNDPKKYWLAGIIMYILSFLGSWSIGLYLLVFPFMLFALAIAHSFGWVKRYWNNIPFIAIGGIIWYFSIKNIDDAFLFFPFRWLV
ncbi:hypothetical protein [Bacillus marasmi]|uniref:hypothetical protein n=1 Tax=Bacillus marasmi TaxID=1926279 RepID=UPI0011C92AD6|nr:hypothetical protein [Bacillus marasmi]